jgi:23S rRNA U2552 (ribose-2'-O)-methylase RlmE/FtsJ
MYCYRLYSNEDIKPPEIQIETTPLKNGFAELLSIDLQCNNRINRAKSNIGKYNSYIWEDVKKYTNPYEYICSFNKNKSNMKAVALLKPLSRSFFKMIEIINEFCPEILNNNNIERLISVHIAEGPGGFIEATRYIRNRINSASDCAFGMTLVRYDINKNIPGWKQSQDFLINHPEVKIINGADGTGDIYNPANINYLNTTMRNQESSGAYLITADGGFDFSIDYNLQEQTSSKLIFSQIISALKMQKNGGTFVCKFFDINLYFTTQMLYLLYVFYNDIIIYKPFTSRIANSEKYIICRGFKGISNEYLDLLINVLNDWNKYINKTINYIFKNIPESFISRIKEINKLIIDGQINSINTAITLIKTKKHNIADWQQMNLDKQLCKAREWCRKYHIPYR